MRKSLERAEEEALLQAVVIRVLLWSCTALGLLTPFALYIGKTEGPVNSAWALLFLLLLAVVLQKVRALAKLIKEKKDAAQN